jgi:glycolate oxidase FAD binding subunit
VNGFGEAYKAGGRVVKNVTGFDLPKLMCGAMGTLGPLMEVILRAFPKAEATSVVVVRGLDDDEGLALIRRIWSAHLQATALLLLPKRLALRFPEFPAVGLGKVDGSTALVRLDGSAATLSTKHDLLNELVTDLLVSPVENGDGLVAKAASVVSFGDTLEDVWLVHVPPTAASQVIANVEGDWIVDWVGARIWIRDTPGVDAGWPYLARELGGSAVLVRASAETRRRIPPFTPESPVRAELTRRVKAAFDPLRLFNPGRMWDGV